MPEPTLGWDLLFVTVKPVNRDAEGAGGGEVSCYQQPHPSDPFPCLGLAYSAIVLILHNLLVSS